MTNFKNHADVRVAVTGASGYIGSALVDSLSQSTSELLCVSRSEMPPRKNMRSMIGDIRTFETWVEIVGSADVIYHLAGNTSVYIAAKDPAESLNSTLLPINQLIKAARELGRRPKVINASTVTLYGLTTDLPVSETQVPNPATLYDLHKLFAEQQLTQATRQGLLEGVSLRLANVYGPSSSVSSSPDRGVLNRVAMLALQGQNIALYGDGNYIRDYVFLDDVVNAMLLAGAASGIQGEVFNIGSGIGTTLKQAFELVAVRAQKITGTRVAIESIMSPSGTDPIEFRNFIAQNEKFSRATGWEPLVSIEDGVNMLMLKYLGQVNL
ncbi:MAG: NAD-dependent epimerase/dehydratase family protein [Chlorobiaceae bacterium]